MCGKCLNRREFLLVTAAAAAGCAAHAAVVPELVQTTSIDAGPAAQFAADNVYSQFANRGFFIVRKGDQLFALSSICTHRKRQLEVLPDETFYCKAHGSSFDPTGKVTEGPATIDLPKLSTKIDERGHLIVVGIA